ncbi:glutathione S-transferase N-terminal domain-containing protein [Psychrobacter sp. NPDC078370]|jgi:RNA polymerase-associated protein|uniref:Starvation protein A n=1 Tax=Psychrobacter piscatorii TaxID=554343 RepID=A0A0T6DSU7_9GAMM|nr:MULTISPECIES: glutathione S-transferase N-terminal domain-containing protein [Psychrobacter]KRU22992.1 starvation protein A [Psychrobacter piscatorii]MCG3842425.1 glutathione S-transferase N-terminal domain-containing protein [Psychrobacter sp. Ps1]OEH69114.1 MAG: starvation protein A [Psychrobacter sp. B29-1]OLF35073.1 starvation protein A [Psychrobacter sp. C 20.9]PKG65173.1 starvation protein A [Psychrobacter sp. Choline-02u-13]|tara:strand:- start:176 stop:790 length:615 start_codon:yes stop_codon:yes gene_type:complete
MIDANDIPSSQLILYADDGYDSHVVRLLLEEKKLAYYLSRLHSERPEDLTELNPYHTLPVLQQREIALYEINVIFEYLEERYHTNKLLPETPQERAQFRQLAWRIQRDWLVLGKRLLTHPDSFNKAQAAVAKKQLSDSLITLSPLFAHKPYFMADEFGWCDVLLAPLLWRLDEMGIELPRAISRPLFEYQTRVFERSSFQKSVR